MDGRTGLDELDDLDDDLGEESEEGDEADEDSNGTKPPNLVINVGKAGIDLVRYLLFRRKLLSQ